MKTKQKNSSQGIVLTAVLAAAAWAALNVFLIINTFEKNSVTAGTHIPQPLSALPASQLHRESSAASSSSESSESSSSKPRISPGIFGRLVFLPDTREIFVLNGHDWTGMINGQAVYEKNDIRTPGSSQADLQLTSGQRIRIDKNSEIILESSGAILVISGKISTFGGPLEMRTSDGIRALGTGKYNLEKTGNETRISASSGSVDVGSDGKTVLVGKNQGTIIDAGAPPQDPFNLPSAPASIKLHLH
jgi:hypothetical protein